MFGIPNLKPEAWNLKLSLGARGGIEPRAFPPSSQRFGLEDRCRERGPGIGFKFQVQSFRFDPPANLKPETCNLKHRFGRGVRPTRLFELHDPDSHRSAGMSHAPITGGSRQEAVGRKPVSLICVLLPPAFCLLILVPEEGLKPSTSGL